MNRFNTSEERDELEFVSFCEKMEDHLTVEVFEYFYGHDIYPRYLNKLFAKFRHYQGGEKDAARLLSRTYSLFHENAANRWRRWDYVKPEAGFIMYAIRHRTSITTPMIMEISHESEMRGDFSGWHWYPIPKID